MPKKKCFAISAKSVCASYQPCGRNTHPYRVLQTGQKTEGGAAQLG